MELTYHRKGDYLFPNLTLEEEPVTIGKYGMLRKTYLMENKKNLYQSLLLTGKLNSHLLEVEQTARERMEVLLKGLEKNFPSPDKRSDQMGWIAHQNMLRTMAEENILKELVFN